MSRHMLARGALNTAVISDGDCIMMARMKEHLNGFMEYFEDRGEEGLCRTAVPMQHVCTFPSFSFAHGGQSCGLSVHVMKVDHPLSSPRMSSRPFGLDHVYSVQHMSHDLSRSCVDHRCHNSGTEFRGASRSNTRSCRTSVLDMLCL